MEADFLAFWSFSVEVAARCQMSLIQAASDDDDEDVLLFKKTKPPRRLVPDCGFYTPFQPVHRYTIWPLLTQSLVSTPS